MAEGEDEKNVMYINIIYYIICRTVVVYVIIIYELELVYYKT